MQDVAFVCAAVYCAHLGGRVVRSWQFGLRTPGVGWASAAGMILLLLMLFVMLSVVWSDVLNPTKEKLLEQLGSNESEVLLLLSAALTCVVAPICEEFLFRGYIFTALRNWRGTLARGADNGGRCSEACTRGRRRRSTWCRWPGSASGCACSTATAARCTPAS